MKRRFVALLLAVSMLGNNSSFLGLGEQTVYAADKTAVEEEKKHTLVNVEFEWDAEYNCKAHIDCQDKGCDYETTKECEVSSKVTVQANCQKAGEELYTALCEFNGKTFKDEKKKVLPVTDHKKVTKPGKEPTCVAPGYTESVVCEYCGKNFDGNSKIEATGHNYGEPVYNWTEHEECRAVFTCTKEKCKDEVTKKCDITYKKTEPGCVTDGSEVYTASCEFQGKEYQGEDIVVIPAKGHTEKVTKEAKAPTCTEGGWTANIVCEVCKVVVQETEVIPATGHTAEVEAAKEATCTEDGYTAKTFCKVCNETLRDNEVIKATGHTYKSAKFKWADGEIKSATVVCEVCGYTETKACEIEEKITKEATCTETGEKSYKAVVEVDGQIFESDEHTESIEKLPHEAVVTKEAKAPTCTEDGYTVEEKCKVCDEELKTSTVIPAIGHTEEEVTPAKEATCTEAGYTVETKCSTCGIQMKASTVVEAKGHTEKSVDGKIPTCTEDGYTESVVCVECGATLEEAEVRPAAHKYDGGVFEWTGTIECTATITCTECGVGETVECKDFVIEKIDETCTEAGKKYITAICIYDGQAFEDIKEDETYDRPALGHEYEEDFCVRCGEEKPLAEIIFVSEKTEVVYTGKAIDISDDIYEVIKGTGEVTLEYYVDSECEIPTYAGDESKEASSPKEAGRYYVRAVIDGDEEYKANCTEETHLLIIKPDKVASLKAKNQTSAIKLTWDENEDVDGYIIYKRKYGTPASEYKVIKTINNGKTTSYVDDDNALGARYMYSIAAYKTAEDGKRVTGDKLSTATQIVRMKVKSVKNYSGYMKVSWNKVEGVDKYELWRKVYGQDDKYIRVATIKDGKTSYEDKADKVLVNGRRTYYKVVAVYNKAPKVVGESAVASNYYLTRATISSLAASGTKAIKVTWKKNSKVTGYEIRYSTSKSFEEAKVKTVESKDTVSTTIKKLSKNKTYYVQVRAYKTKNDVKYYSAWSASKNVKTK